ncbi:hypothetical protein PDIDSM_4760 [Penicillium digitatum]|nr:hypothetical protein PDIDSM_4760 [Penicillium digitatum]
MRRFTPTNPLPSPAHEIPLANITPPGQQMLHQLHPTTPTASELVLRTQTVDQP